MMKKPNLIFVFADQWRAQAFGYAGDPNARTPNIDRFAGEAVNFRNATSGCPVCSPYRAGLFTGQYPLEHGVFLNDVSPRFSGPTFAEALSSGGYRTAYIGKWHAGGGPRLEPTPPEYRRGFEFWRAVECTHDYNHSIYYTETGEKRLWEGYDALAQTREAAAFIRQRANDKAPFALFLSWGPPHEPYETAPAEFRALFDKEKIVLRPNVPAESYAAAREELAGYYAHGAALDSCFGRIADVLEKTGLERDTILVFTSDHGDMLYSQGFCKKQHPWEESVRVPFLIRWPEAFEPGVRDEPVDAQDMMPTLLTLCSLPVPDSAHGRNFADALTNPNSAPRFEETYLMHLYSYHQSFGMPEWRGIRTLQYTYAVRHDGPWLLYDNLADPFQMKNLVHDPAFGAIRNDLDVRMKKIMKERGDDFLPGIEYVKRFGHSLDENGDHPYFHWNSDREEYLKKHPGKPSAEH